MALCMLSRIEGTLGGQPPRITIPAVEWGQTSIERAIRDEEGLYRYLKKYE